MTSLDIGTTSKKLSFAKIAAAGLKATSKPSQPSTSVEPNARDGVGVLLQDPIFVANQHGNEAVVLQPPQDMTATLVGESVQIPASTIPSEPLIVGALSSLYSSDNAKPPSTDGKSTTSVTTFAMDEKESIRPDDSASMKAAVDDEDGASQNEANAPDLRLSDQGARAFQEQLNEISAIDPHTTRTVAHDSNGNLAPLYGASVVPPITDFVPITAHDPLMHDVAPDPKLMEALDNPRDRIWVLKLEQDIIDFVKDPKESSLILPQCNSFYRMLAHKIGDYYMLGHAVDESNSAVRLYKTATSRIARPLTGVVTPSTAASTPPPSAMQMKILRRGVDLAGPAIVNGANGRSKNASENGESGNEDDLKKAVTREEREARYEAARLRIMGSARPSEICEATKEKSDSRSSSVTGKRKKKQRADSNDDFEARSAYSSYIAQPLVPNTGFGPNNFTYPAAQPYAMTMSPTYPASPGYQQLTPHAMQGSGYWYQQAPQSIDNSMIWPQSPQQPYDLSRDFDRAMSLQQPPIPTYASPQQQFPAMQYDQHAYQTPPYMMATHGLPAGVHAAQHSYGPISSHGERPFTAENQMQSTQPYAYGQLPSQALGRPPNALEHPLPGSYKSRHFNPQSITFVPSHSNGDALHPYTPQRTVSGYQSAQIGPGNLERQLSSHSQASSFDSPHRLPHGVSHRMQPPAALTHPLPQPVFASQQVSNASLPPKPSVNHGNGDSSRSAQLPAHPGHNESTIAKWGAPASLPAKPPRPSSETMEQPRLPASPQRTGIASRMPIFGSMPPP